MSDDLDLDLEDDFEEEVVSKSSLKELWDNNPFLKIGLLVVVAVIAGFLYTNFISSEEVKKEDKSIMKAGVDVRGTVGEEVSVEYQKAIEEKNKERKEWAEISRGSALPTPIGKPRGQLEIEEKVDKDSLSIDPLKEWRKTAEARSFEMDFPEEEEIIDEAPVPEIVPVIEPIRPVVEETIDPELTSKLAEQMGTIIASKEPKPSQTQRVTPETSEYVKWREKQEMLEQQMAENASFSSDLTGGATESSSISNDDSVTVLGDEEEEPVVLIAAGDVVYAQLLNNLNSDVPGPALAHILSGPMAGARAIGSFKRQEEFLVLEFNTLVKDGVSYSIASIALDPDTTLNGMVTDVNHHYFKRIVLPAASEFISGIGEGIAQTTTTVTSTAGGSQSSTEALDTEEIIGKGLQKSFDTISQLVKKGANVDITVTLDKGTPMGLLFTETLYDE